MIYIQSNYERTLPDHFDAACALFGAIESGLDYRLTSIEEITSGKFDSLIRSRLFVGSVEFMQEVFKRIGISNVGVPCNSKRNSEIITLKEARDRVAKGEKLFIKPIKIKLFTGLVLDGMQHSCLKDLSTDTQIMAYKPVESPIDSEWRIYIQNDKMLDARHYSGDFTINPNYDYVLEIIKNNKNKFPCAYTIDVGILESGENVVIEYNDMWAIGNYGINNRVYLSALKERYFEIIKTNPIESKMEKTTKSYKIFIDDERMPSDSANYMSDHIKYRKWDWTIIRSFDQLVEFIEKEGIDNIEYVSYDHDLADTHYNYTKEWGNEEFYDTMKEKTGYECAKLIVDKCMDKNVPHPPFDVHSMNTVGRLNIFKYIQNYNKHQENN